MENQEELLNVLMEEEGDCRLDKVHQVWLYRSSNKGSGPARKHISEEPNLHKAPHHDAMMTSTKPSVLRSSIKSVRKIFKKQSIPMSRLFRFPESTRETRKVLF
jgi:hypothetical protein